jgi:hypothetical protein
VIPNRSTLSPIRRPAITGPESREALKIRRRSPPLAQQLREVREPTQYIRVFSTDQKRAIEKVSRLDQHRSYADWRCGGGQGDQSVDEKLAVLARNQAFGSRTLFYIARINRCSPRRQSASREHQSPRFGLELMDLRVQLRQGESRSRGPCEDLSDRVGLQPRKAFGAFGEAIGDLGELGKLGAFPRTRGSPLKRQPVFVLKNQRSSTIAGSTSF